MKERTKRRISVNNKDMDDTKGMYIYIYIYMYVFYGEYCTYIYTK